MNFMITMYLLTDLYKLKKVIIGFGLHTYDPNSILPDPYEVSFKTNSISATIQS